VGVVVIGGGGDNANIMGMGVVEIETKATTTCRFHGGTSRRRST
jgi:hypothetical protein